MIGLPITGADRRVIGIGFSFSLFFSGFGVLQAQTLTPTPTFSPTPMFSPSSPILTPTPTPRDVEAIDQDIKATRDQIDLLTDQREDTSLEFRRLTRVYVQEILQDKITAAKRAGNKKKAAQIQKEIDDWNQVRTQEWDQDRSIIDAKAKSRQLQRERARGLEERLIERLKEQGLQKPVAELEEGLRLLDQVADLDAQEVDLEKQLNAAREQYDYTTANQVRVKLKDIRSKYGDLFKQATEKMKRIQGAPPAPELEQQNL